MTRRIEEPLFETGQVVVTPGALAVVEGGIILYILLRRHQRGQWDEMDPEDAQMNRDAVESGQDRIFSSFMFGGEKIWVITEMPDETGHRPYTTILLPEEY